MVDVDPEGLLATTSRGLEGVAAEEIEAVTGAPAGRDRPGLVRIDADERAVRPLTRRARTINRVLVVLVRDTIAGLADVYDLASSLDIERYVDPEQSFAVRAQRHGYHQFGSPDVADRVGQAVVDAFRSATGRRLAVDLDDPDVIFRAMVRNERFTLAIDATGARSLHRRSYRVREHDAALQPTVAAAMLRLADYDPGDAVLDPMCGCGTIPIEAALWERGRSPAAGRSDLALERLRFLDVDGTDPASNDVSDGDSGRPGGTDDTTAVVDGVDVDPTWIAGARENATVARVADAVSFAVGDATGIQIDHDAVVVDLPFGVRTDDADLRRLYDDFAANLRAGRWSRLVVLATKPAFLDLEFDRTLAVRRGRIETTVGVVLRD